MEKTYNYAQLQDIRSNYEQSQRQLRGANATISDVEGKRVKRIIWAVVTTLLTIGFFLITYYGEAAGEMSFAEMIQSAKIQLLGDMGSNDTNILGGLLCSGIAFVIAIYNIMGAIVVSFKIGSARNSRVQAEKYINEIEKIYLYSGKNWNLESVKDTKSELDALGRDVKDLIVALYIFRDRKEVYFKNWLTRLGLEGVTKVFAQIEKTEYASNSTADIMLTSNNSNWNTQVASLLSQQIMAAGSMFSLAPTKKPDYEGKKMFTTAYKNSDYIHRNEEDKDFLPVVKDVAGYLPNAIARILQDKVKKEMGI